MQPVTHQALQINGVHPGQQNVGLLHKAVV